MEIKFRIGIHNVTDSDLELCFLSWESGPRCYGFGSGIMYLGLGVGT